MQRCYATTAEGVSYRQSRTLLPPMRSHMSTLPLLRRGLIALLAAASLGAAGCAPESLADQRLPQPSTDMSATSAPEPDVQPTSAEPSVHDDPQSDPVESEVPEPEATAEAILKQGDEGDRVRELQHRLLQLEWFEGKITGVYGEDTRLAVAGFQAKRELSATGEVDEASWNKLVSMTRQPTNDEMHNILVPGPSLLSDGDKGDKVKDLQARLKQIAWYAPKIDGSYGAKTIEAVKGFQAKREIPVTGEVDQRTLDRLAAMTRKPTADELNNVVATPKPSTMKLDDRCLQGRVICISKSQRRLALVVDGQISSTMDVRFGSELTPTRNGVFSVYWKSRNHVSKLYGSKMPYALFFSGGQAVHYSSDFAARGYNGSSHGCVNVRDKGKVAALFDSVSEGDKVVVY